MLILFPPPEHGSAAIAANGFRFRVPYGTLLRVFGSTATGETKFASMAPACCRLKSAGKAKSPGVGTLCIQANFELPKLPSNSLVDLMMHRGTIACAEIRFKRNNLPSNFNAMCHARVMYEAAVEAIGKDVVAKSMETEDAALRPARLRPKQPPTKDLRPRGGLPQYRYLTALEFLPYRS